MRCIPFLTVTALLLIGSNLATTPADAQASNSSQLKTAIVFNILRFVTFPPASGSTQLNLCVNRGVSGGDSLSTLRGKTVGGRAINVKTIQAADGSENCDVVYLGGTSAAEISLVRQKGVLTIGEGSSALKAGGIIGLVMTGKQVRFEVSMRSAQQSNIGVSSQLLRLASRVDR